MRHYKWLLRTLFRLDEAFKSSTSYYYLVEHNSEVVLSFAIGLFNGVVEKHNISYKDKGFCLTVIVAVFHGFEAISPQIAAPAK